MTGTTIPETQPRHVKAATIAAKHAPATNPARPVMQGTTESLPRALFTVCAPTDTTMMGYNRQLANNATSRV